MGDSFMITFSSSDKSHSTIVILRIYEVSGDIDSPKLQIRASFVSTTENEKRHAIRQITMTICRRRCRKHFNL